MGIFGVATVSLLTPVVNGRADEVRVNTGLQVPTASIFSHKGEQLAPNPHSNLNPLGNQLPDMPSGIAGLDRFGASTPAQAKPAAMLQIVDFRNFRNFCPNPLRLFQLALLQ